MLSSESNSCQLFPSIRAKIAAETQSYTTQDTGAVSYLDIKSKDAVISEMS